MTTERFFLIRHLPTAYNREGRIQGQRDIPIEQPAAGEAAAMESNRERLRRIGPFDAVLASTLMRSRMTARCYGLPFRVEPLVDELDFGPYEGRLKSDLIRELGRGWMETPHLLTLGEPIINVQTRIETFVDRYSAANKVLVFGHGAWMRAFVCLRRTGSIAEMNKIEVEHNRIIAC